MVLADFQITDRAENGMITPFRKEQLNPASYDVTVGSDYILDGIGETFSFENTTPFPLERGEFILIHSAEIFKLPDMITAQFALKSSRAREGFEHSMAGFCDPGWQGSLTMELTNISKRTLYIHQGMRIGQMVFMQMMARPDNPYKGRYQGINTVSGSKA